MVEWIKVGGSSRPTDLVGLGALSSLVSRQVLDEAIELHGCRAERVRKLPAHVVVYLPMALCLFADDDYEELTEKLTGLLADMPGSLWEPPTRGAVTQARQRLGAEAVREVFDRVARPAAAPATAGAWLGRWRLMAIDGFTLDLPDTAVNLAEFPNDSAGRYETVYPQARVVAISECTCCGGRVGLLGQRADPRLLVVRAVDARDVQMHSVGFGAPPRCPGPTRPFHPIAFMRAEPDGRNQLRRVHRWLACPLQDHRMSFVPLAVPCS